MKKQVKEFGAAISGAVLLALAGCGGGSSSGPSTPGPAPAPTTTNVSTTVIDGAILNATVCLDKNGNGLCDTDEVQGKTDAAGNVTLAVPNADVGKYPIIAAIGTDAVDADHGPVTVAYTMSAPADQSAVVSPLTTLVQQTIASTGASTSDAAKSVQDTTGITTSLFQDFTKTAAPTDGTVSAATIARMLVVATQTQSTAVASAVGTTALDQTKITQADIDKAIQKKLLELLPSLITALSDPAVQAATGADKETALMAAATSLVNSAGLTPAGVSTVVAINNQASSTAPVTPDGPSAFVLLRTLNFSDASNYYLREFTGTAAQATPDSANTTRFIERRVRSVAGKVAKWGSGSDPWRNADLSWSGSAWVGCPINTENTSGVRDAQGNNTYTYCGPREAGKSSRAAFDIGGQSMSNAYAMVRAAGYTDLTIADPAVLGGATFPAGSKLVYQTSTPLTYAATYTPAGADSPAGTSSAASQYSAAVAAGGVATSQEAGAGCNAAETSTNGTTSTNLESWIASKTGTPCIYTRGTVSYNNTSYESEASNEWWGNSTANVGKIGSAPVSPGSTSTGYYTGNTVIRAAFGGGNTVTYYACRERFSTGSSRNCVSIGTGNYAITTLGDARVLSTTNPPAQAAALTYYRVWVERGGVVFNGYVSKPVVTNSARLNTVATAALLSQLGIAGEDPETPLALTAGAYQGTWDFRLAGSLVSPTNGITLYLGANGSSSCQDKASGMSFACLLTIDPATGAASYTAESAQVRGVFDFSTGLASGTFETSLVTPPSGSFVGGRR